ncbi:MAG: DUF3147 family protein [Candidatus Hadarchaeum sp.]|uniref:DUF3147 family protein n=1 Tax=Candidatus Hadarchaeum sp. TaxID=2883567 RepID=UPI003D0E6774
MKLSVRYVLFDFIVGGILVSGALLVASLLGPTAGGILAGAPIRTAAVIFLEYLHRGLDSAAELSRGVVLAMVSNVFFAISLYLTLPKFGIAVSFLIAGLVFIIAAALLTGLVP